MKLTNKKVVEQALARIDIIREKQEWVYQALSLLRARTPRTKPDAGNIMQLLHEAELDEWRNVGMWGLTLDQAEQDRLKAAFHDHFMGKNKHVAYWLNDGISPTTWFAADEEEFRKMAREAFSPKETNLPKEPEVEE
jgi:hypothetical protein